MLISIAASLFVLAADPPEGALCVQSAHDNGDYVTYVIPADRLSAFSTKAADKNRRFDVVDCPGEWDAASTQKLCDAFDGFSDDLKAAMTEIYAVSPDEMCQAAKDVDQLQAKT